MITVGVCCILSLSASRGTAHPTTSKARPKPLSKTHAAMVRLLKSKARARLSVSDAVGSLLCGLAVAMLCWSVVDHLLPIRLAAPAPATPQQPSVVHVHHPTPRRPVPVRTPPPPPARPAWRGGSACGSTTRGGAQRHRWRRPQLTRPRPRVTASRTTSRCAALSLKRPAAVLAALEPILMVWPRHARRCSTTCPT